MPEPKEWKLKTNEDGQVAIDGLKVTYIAPDGKELTLDPPSMYSKIGDLGKESKQHRDAAEAAQKTLAIFEGVDDLSEYKKKADEAIQAVADFKDKDWRNAEKVKELKREMADSYEAKLGDQKASYENALKERENVLSMKDAQINKLLVSNNFATHPLFGGPKPKSKLTPDMAEAYFAKHFRVETAANGVDLVLRAYKDPGTFKEMIYSRENPGDPANFVEAMDYMWEMFPGKDSLTSASPSGSHSSSSSDDDDTPTDTELASLEKQYADAKAANNVQLLVPLKNKIFRLKQKIKKQ